MLVLFPAKLNEAGYKSVFGAFFDLEKVSFSKSLAKLLTKKNRIKQIGEPSLSSNVKTITMLITTLTSFSKIDKKNCQK